MTNIQELALTTAPRVQEGRGLNLHYLRQPHWVCCNSGLPLLLMHLQVVDTSVAALQSGGMQGVEADSLPCCTLGYSDRSNIAVVVEGCNSVDGSSIDDRQEVPDLC